MENIKTMKVKDLKKELSKYDDELDIIIRFALDEEDDWGHNLVPVTTQQTFEDRIIIYAEYADKKEDCDSVGQVYLVDAYKKALEEEEWNKLMCLGMK